MAKTILKNGNMVHGANTYKVKSMKFDQKVGKSDLSDTGTVADGKDWVFSTRIESTVSIELWLGTTGYVQPTLGAVASTTLNFNTDPGSLTIAGSFAFENLGINGAFEAGESVTLSGTFTGSVTFGVHA